MRVRREVRRGVCWSGVLAWLCFGASAVWAQPARITEPLDLSNTKILKGNTNPRAARAEDQGPLDPSQPVSGMTLVFKPSAAQVSNLQQFLEEQRDPTSPNYHQWLTAGQFGDRFGMNPEDLEKVASWLRTEGFRIDYTAQGRTWIMFSGTAGQVETAFHTELHHYSEGGRTHFANASAPSIPAAFAPVVLLVRGLDDFRAQPRVRNVMSVGEYTAGGGTHALVPGDLATIYDINPLYQNGINGTGQKIAVVGQTDIYMSDIEHFRSEFGLPTNNPQLVLVPGSQDPGVSADDLIESSLDLEYAGGIGRNATVLFVYSTDVWDSIQYAVDDNLAPVISTSYGYCEQGISDDPASTAAYMQQLAQQANSSGITWLAASGDSGAADCDSTTEQVATQGLAVDLPASVPEVTGVGGTEFAEAGGDYWSSSNGSNGSSALSYIPETAWNDTAALGSLLATGGGMSQFFSKPAWQAGPGVPNDGARDVPDIALAAAVAHDPYMIYVQGQTWYVGGTSAPTPVFSGVLSLLNQYVVANGIQSQPGLGNINPTLYGLAQGSSAIFHDITTGSNIVPCASGSLNCSGGELGYDAGAGYDRTTGLGSVDVYRLVTLWNGGASAAVATQTSVSASATSIGANGSTVLTATVQAASGSAAPTGTVSFALGGKALGTAALSVSGNVATASLTVEGSQLSAGANSIAATYEGTASFQSSSGSISITVGITVTPVSVTPNSGSGLSQTFSFTFSDTAGASDILGGQIVINSTLSGANACYMGLQRVSGSNFYVYLANNSAAFTSSRLIGSAGTLQNSQCSLNAGASSVSLSGDILTVNLALSFTASFAGSKNIYAYIQDATVGSGWVTEGAWTVPGSSGPTPVSVTPSGGSGAAQTFSFTYSDPAGASDIAGGQIVINSTLNGVNACYLGLQGVGGGTFYVYLANNSGSFTSSRLIGGAGTLQNSQCSLNAGASSVSLSGNTLTVNLALTFTASFAGTQNIYAYGQNATVGSSWVTEGTWTVPGSSGPTPVSVTPSNGSGSAQIFSFTYSDPAGASDIAGGQIVINSTLTGLNACYLGLQRAGNGNFYVYLANNNAAFTSSQPLGSTGTMQNSQCSLNVGESSVLLSGDTLTVNLALSFTASFAGTQNIFVYIQNASVGSGWMNEGAWTVP
jgi:uncharacterized membrane protein